MISEKESLRRMILYTQGLSDVQIAEKLGTTRDSVRYWRAFKKLPSNLVTTHVPPCRACDYGEQEGKGIHCTNFDIYMKPEDFCSYGEVNADFDD